MSQKSGKRGRRPTTDTDSSPVAAGGKISTSQTNGGAEGDGSLEKLDQNVLNVSNEESPTENNAVAEQNGTTTPEKTESQKQHSTDTNEQGLQQRVTRSTRSKTPQIESSASNLNKTPTKHSMDKIAEVEEEQKEDKKKGKENGDDKSLLATKESPVKVSEAAAVAKENDEESHKERGVPIVQNGEDKETTSQNDNTPRDVNGDEHPQPDDDRNNSTDDGVSSSLLASSHHGDGEMEALVLTVEDDDEEGEEPHPELMFEEENSDATESSSTAAAVLNNIGKESPVLGRCMTRRSQIRNIPTPKTPKAPFLSVELEQASASSYNSSNNIELPEIKLSSNGGPDDENTTQDSENLSTKAQVGGDSTILEFNRDSTSSPTPASAFLSNNKDHSFGEAMRRLSTRRTIRPIAGAAAAEDYRKRLLMKKSDLNRSFPTTSRDVFMAPRKRKNSESEDDIANDYCKRTKGDSASASSSSNNRFYSIFTSPLSSFKNPFSRNDVISSSTPKLTGYKDRNVLLDGRNDFERQEIDVADPVDEKRWCSIM